MRRENVDYPNRRTDRNQMPEMRENDYLQKEVSKMLRRLKFVCVVIVGLLICLIALASYAYDQVKPENRTQFINNQNEFSYVRIETHGTAIGMYRDSQSWEWKTRQGTFRQGGSGFVVKNGYILTAAHVVVPEMAEVVGGKYQTDQRALFKVLKQIILVYGFSSAPFVAEIHYINHELDIAILRCDDGKDILKPLPYPIEFEPEGIHAGDVVCAVVHDRNEEGGLSMNVHLEYGYVREPKPTGENEYSIAWLNIMDITLDLKVIPGDSGSPLFAFSGGKPVIICVVRAQSTLKSAVNFAVQLPMVDRYLEIR